MKQMKRILVSCNENNEIRLDTAVSNDWQKIGAYNIITKIVYFF